MNNQEREMWVMNDEGLYTWFIRSKLSITRFIRVNRVDIDETIKVALK